MTNTPGPPSRDACRQVVRANLAVETLPSGYRPPNVPSAPGQDETTVHAVPVQLSVQLNGSKGSADASGRADTGQHERTQLGTVSRIS